MDFTPLMHFPYHCAQEHSIIRYNDQPWSVVKEESVLFMLYEDPIRENTLVVAKRS